MTPPKTMSKHGPYDGLPVSADRGYHFIYLDTQVLGKYRSQLNRYELHVDRVQGWIGVRPEVRKQMPPEDVFYVNFGKRKLAGGGIALVVMGKDLSFLPYKEQLYWAAHELSDTAFAPFDPDFQKYLEQELGGQFVEYDDPILLVYDAVELVNRNASHEIFRSGRANPHLTYPVYDNQRDYSVAHNELRKVVGPDHLDVRSLRELLDEAGIKYEQAHGAWSLFKALVRDVAGQDAPRILEPLERVSRERSLVAHEIDPLSAGVADFTTRFMDDCRDVAAALQRLGNHLALKIPEETDN